jgi:hypothetical protein
MVNQTIDRRKHRRAYFSIEDDIIGNFILFGKREISFDAHILNLSRGGLHFTVNKNQGILPMAGDKLRLIQIKGEAALNLEFYIELDIHWILDHESLAHIGCGCEFAYISKTALDRISEFIDSKYVRKTVK